jgi:hypothetical protein
MAMNWARTRRMINDEAQNADGHEIDATIPSRTVSPHNNSRCDASIERTVDLDFTDL